MKMKKLLFILILLQYGVVHTQCVNNVSTDYEAPSNNKLPDNTVLPNDENKLLNRFNWFPVNNGFYSNYEPINISYAGIDIDDLSNIMNDQSSPTYYNYIYEGPLPTRANGWELLLLNLGRWPNGDPITSQEGLSPNLPYIVLYNRYSGIVRVFVAFGVDGEGADAVDITLRFENENLSGLLRLNNGTDQALDLETVSTMTKSIAKDPNLSYKWMSTDFQVAYDPCTCYHPSRLSISINKVFSQTIQAVGGAISLDNQPLVNNSNIVNPQGFLTGINYTEDTYKNGVVMYKTLDNMIKNYQKKYEDYNKALVEQNEHNKRVKQNLALLKVASTIVTLVTT